MNASPDVLSVLLLVPAGFIIGILAAAPIGPVNIFVVQRTLARGFRVGFAAGIGATLGDGLLAALAAFGFSATDGALGSHTGMIQLVGGVLLIAFGAKLLVETPHAPEAPDLPRLMDHAGAIPQTFFLAVTNPGAILGMFAMVGTLTSAVGGFKSAIEPAVLTLSVTATCLLWWFGLTRLVARIQHRLSIERLLQINKIAGVLLVIAGVVLLGFFAADIFGWSA